MASKKICMVGHFGVGKTSLVRRFVSSEYEDKYLTTIGVKIVKKDVEVRSKQVTLMLWDIAGKDELAPVNLAQVNGASGYILVVDGCRASTLPTAVDLQKNITKMYGPLPFVVAVNKVDLESQWELKRADIESCGWTSFDTSAKTGVGVNDMFLRLADKILEGDLGK
jgi:small GTP-binding protein